MSKMKSASIIRFWADHAVEEVAKLTDGDMATAVFDATGHKGALEGGIDYMAHGGRYVLVGLSKGDLTFAHPPKIHAKEVVFFVVEMLP